MPATRTCSARPSTAWPGKTRRLSGGRSPGTTAFPARQADPADLAGALAADRVAAWGARYVTNVTQLRYQYETEHLGTVMTLGLQLHVRSGSMPPYVRARGRCHRGGC